MNQPHVTRFKQILLADWRQFSAVKIDLHPKMTIITGANGSGKTTILNILAQHFGWSTPFVATPVQTKQGLLYSVDAIRIRDLLRAGDPVGMDVPAQVIGEVIYENGTATNLTVPAVANAAYTIQGIGAHVLGFNIPSHRATYAQTNMSTLPLGAKGPAESFSAYHNVVQARARGGGGQPNLALKESLISLAVYGFSSEVLAGDERAKALYFGFQDTLRKVLPHSLGFRELAVRPPEVILMTEAGDFSLDAVSGGLASILDIAWQLFIFAQDHPSFSVTFDEPENHLHPELQLHILPTLLNAFPAVQFIVSSHSPIIVASVLDCNLYALHYEEIAENEASVRRVIATKLDVTDTTGTTDETLRKVLGVPHTMPDWLTTKVQEVIRDFIDRDITEESAAALRRELTAVGLDRYFPITLAKLARDQRQSE